jgi:hypothetical protein
LPLLFSPKVSFRRLYTMRFSTTVASASAVAFLLSACSGATPTTPAGTAVSNIASPAHFDAGKTSDLARGLKPPQRLAVTNFFNPGYFDGVVVLNRSYKVIQTITDGMSNPNGAYYDSDGNLYVANSAGPNVTEYNKKGTLTFTYSTGLGDPGGVTVDHGNVYVSDWGDDKASVVVEYAQGSNRPLVSCSTGFANAAVATDRKGNVFVSVDVPNGSNGGYILEYKHGLSGCQPITLGVGLRIAGSLLIDKHDDIVVSDRYAGVDIIPPPYKKIRSTITGFNQATALALNKEQNLLYVVNFFNSPSANEVVVDKYPSGTNVTTLGPSDGIPYAEGVAVYPP